VKELETKTSALKVLTCMRNGANQQIVGAYYWTHALCFMVASVHFKHYVEFKHLKQPKMIMD